MNVMLCEKLSLEDAKKMDMSGWVIERKLDGVRAYIENGRLYDRRNKDITKQFPEFVNLKKMTNQVIDGEIVAASLIFNDVVGRMHMRDKFMIRLQSERSPAMFIAFDMVRPSMTLADRKQLLMEFGLSSYCRETFPWLLMLFKEDSFADGWRRVEENEWEGLVIKRLDAFYQEGKRSPDCLKVKAFQEATATFVKMDIHPKGCRLETADGRSVNVNGAQAEEVIRIFREKGEVIGEVQYLPQSGSEAWRFPSWRGSKVQGSSGWVRIGER
jgi:ATP-dependent DNA ligase